MSSDPALVPAADKKLDKPFVAGQRGTLLEHGLKFELATGRTLRTWTTGPIKDRPDYSVGKTGELRHTFPQFKGSKKNRKRFRARLRAALDTTPPVGYYELYDLKEKLKALDLLISVETGKWFTTPVIDITVEDLRNFNPTFPRACRLTPADKHEKDPTPHADDVVDRGGSQDANPGVAAKP